MTSNDPNIRASFQAIDTPVAVDPAFAERVRAAVANLHAEPEHPVGEPIQINTQHPLPTTHSAPRIRWQDLAAAAVLVLALAGLLKGAIRLMREDEPGPTILVAQNTPQESVSTMQVLIAPASPTPVAPELADVPVINSFGSAANDGNAPGVMPPLGTTYDLLWEGPEPEAESGYSGNRAYIAGDYVVRTNGSNTSGAYLSVHDLATGTERWRTDLSLFSHYAITPRGILIALPTDPNQLATTIDYGVTLYDLATGAEIWTTGVRFIATDFDLPVMTAEDESVYLRNGEAGLVALDLATGAERWTFDAAQGEEMIGECMLDNATCELRSEMVDALVIVGDVAYWYVPLSGELVAINSADGSLRWSLNVTERTGFTVPIVHLIGTQWGVIPVVFDQITGNFGETYIGLWNAEDGAEQWTQALRYLNAVVVGDQLLVSWFDPEAGGTCCQLSQIAIETGDLILEETLPEQMVFAWYPESGSLVIGDIYQRSSSNGPITSEQAVVFAVGSDALAPVPAVEIISDCPAVMPGTDGKHVVCYRPDGQFAIYHVSGFAGNVDEELATPTEP